MARLSQDDVNAVLGDPSPASPPSSDGSDSNNKFTRPKGPRSWGKFFFVLFGLLAIYALVKYFLIDKLAHDFPYSRIHVPDQPVFWLVPSPVGWLVNFVFGVIAIWCLLTALPVTRKATRKIRRKLRPGSEKPAKRVWIWKMRRKLFAATTDPPKVIWAQLWWGLSLLPFTVLAVLPVLNERGVVAYALVVAALGLIGWKAWWSGVASAAKHSGNQDAKPRDTVSMWFGFLAVALLLVPAGHGWAWHIDNTSVAADHGPNFGQYCVDYRGDLFACANGEGQRAQRSLRNYAIVKAACKGEEACLDQLRTDGSRESFKAEVKDACHRAATVRDQLSTAQQESVDANVMNESCGAKVKKFYDSPPDTFDGDLQ